VTTGAARRGRGWREVRAEIAERIRRRDWPPGAAIPPEAELADSLGVARTTVNRALRALAEAGMVERRRRSGTRVLAAQPGDARLAVPLVRAEIEATGAAYRYERLARAVEPAPAAAAAALGVVEGAPALRVVCRHWADDRPHQLEQRWINLAVAPGAAQEPFAAQGPNAWLVETMPLEGARHVFSAELATAETAPLLRLSIGAPVFVIERRTWTAAGAITWVRLLHPGDRFRLEAETAPPA
jgi:GntR family histidine utilization transcriptional repressor